MTPTFSNNQVAVQALGLALDDSNKAYYVSAAGPKAALESLRASLLGSKDRVYARPWRMYPSLGMETKAAKCQAIWQPLIGTAWAHAVFVTKPDTLLLVVDPTAARIGHDYDGQRERRARLVARKAEVFAQFAAALRATTDVPLLDAWAPAIWEEAANWRDYGELRAIESLAAWGDCLGAWLVNPGFPWLTFVQALIQKGRLAFEAAPVV